MKISDFDPRVRTVMDIEPAEQRYANWGYRPVGRYASDAQTEALLYNERQARKDEAEGRKVLDLYNSVIRALDDHDPNWRKHRDIGDPLSVAAVRTIQYMSEAVANLKDAVRHREAMLDAIREARLEYHASRRNWLVRLWDWITLHKEPDER